MSNDDEIPAPLPAWKLIAFLAVAAAVGWWWWVQKPKNPLHTAVSVTGLDPAPVVTPVVTMAELPAPAPFVTSVVTMAELPAPAPVVTPAVTPVVTMAELPAPAPVVTAIAPPTVSLVPYADASSTVLLLTLDGNLADSGPARSEFSVGKNRQTGTSVVFSDDQPLAPGMRAAYFERNWVQYQPRTASSFILEGDYLVHGFYRALQPNDDKNRNGLISVGMYTDGLLIRTGDFNVLSDDVYVNGRWVLSVHGLFPQGVWTYFALSRRVGTMRFHTAQRDGQGEWIVRESLIANPRDDKPINPRNLPVMVGTSAHIAGYEGCLGYICNVHIVRLAPSILTRVPFQ